MKGTLENGMYVDFTLLSEDYFSIPEKQINNLNAVLTVVAGKVEYGDKDDHGKTTPAATRMAGTGVGLRVPTESISSHMSLPRLSQGYTPADWLRRPASEEVGRKPARRPLDLALPESAPVS